MSGRVRKNYIFDVTYQIFSMIAPLITTPYVARVLGAEGVGLYSYTYSMATMFVAFAQLGTVTYATREIAYHQNSEEERTVIFWNVVCLRLITTGLSLILYWFVFSKSKDWYLFKIQALCIVAVFFDITWFFTGIEEFGKIAARDIISKVISIACVFMFVRTGQIGKYSFILAFAIIAGRLTSWGYLRRYLCRISVKKIRPFSNFRIVLVLFIPHIATQLYGIVDKGMLGMMMETTAENGYYSQADRIIKLCLAVLNSLTSVITPRMAVLVAQNDFKGVKQCLFKASRFAWLIGLPISAGLFVTIPSIVPWFLGDGYEKVVFLVQVFCVQILFTGCIGSVSGAYMIASGRQTAYAYSISIGTAVNLTLNMLMIPRFYSLGAAVASILAECVIVGLELYSLKSELRAASFIKYAAKYFLPALIMAAVLGYLDQYLSYTPLFSFVRIILGISIYFGILLICKDSLVIENLNAILTVIRKKITARK